MCERYTVNCGIPPIKNTQFIDSAEVARCTLSVGCSTDLDYCVVFVSLVSLFLENVRQTLLTSEWFMPDFPVIPLHFACLWLSQQAPPLLQHSLKILITDQL